MSWRSGMDMASSTTQGWATWPDTLISLTPELFGRPNEENQPAPRRRIAPSTAMPSALFTVVGQP